MIHKFLRGLACAAILLITPRLTCFAQSGWTLAGSDIQNSRFGQSESIIGPANAASLSLQWQFGTANDVSATPSVDTVSNSVYFPDWSGCLYKLSTANGGVIWSHRMTDYGLPPGSISRTTPTLANNMVVIGASATFSSPASSVGGYLMALDPTTGDVIWEVEIDSQPMALITGSPSISNGVIFMGISSAQESLTTPTFRGSVVAVSLATGQILWRTYLAPSGYTGVAVWSSTPAVDIDRNQLYVTTGNNYTVPLAVETCEIEAGKNNAAIKACQASNNYQDSIIALDLTTGIVKWAKKCLPADAWLTSCETHGASCPNPQGRDWDFGSGANLFTATIKGVPTDLVGAGQKSGVYWALNPNNGIVVWEEQVGPGGILGGIEWGTATDGQQVYVAIANSYRVAYNLQPSGALWNGASWAALNAATGQIVWQVPDPSQDPIDPAYGAMALGPVTIANGVLYCADTGGLMFALNASSGKTLWTFQAAGSVNAAPAVVDGVLYWGSGYHNFPRAHPIGTASNTFYSFALPAH